MGYFSLGGGGEGLSKSVGSKVTWEVGEQDDEGGNNLFENNYFINKVKKYKNRRIVQTGDIIFDINLSIC